ncbi:MAG: hypothetical protein ACREMO_06645 [Gemmatimonadales bacterium]
MNRRLWPLVIAVTGAACGGRGGPASAPAPTARRPIEPAHPLFTTALAGQTVSVLPLTILIVDDSLAPQVSFPDRTKALAWADSLLGDALESRGPEVQWVLAPALRKIARRTPGVTVDPDHMGQGIMRVPGIKDVPDPLRTSLRSMVAIAGGRDVLIPATLYFLPDPEHTVRAELTLVLADTRTGKVLWRTVATGFGPTAPRALTSALEVVLPLQVGAR